MSVPKVNLRKRKSKRKNSYFIDFAVNSKRYRLSDGTNKKIALKICQQKELETSRPFGERIKFKGKFINSNRIELASSEGTIFITR